MSTIIQIKRSANVTAPTTADLVEGELAYSQDKANSGAGAKLYIESLDNSDTPVIHAVGGKFYTDAVDGATSNNTADKIVKRDASGNFSAGIITATLYGTANNVPSTGITGDIALGTQTSGNYVANVVVGAGLTGGGAAAEGATPSIALATSGVTANTYGGAAAIPVLTVDQYGRVTAAANTAITVASEAFRTVAVAGQSDIVADSATDTLNVSANTGITLATNATTDTLTIGLATSGVTANTYGGATAIPVITVDQFGRVTTASNSSITTSFTIIGGDNNSDVFNAGDYLSIEGDNGISTTLSSTGNNTDISVSLTTTGVSASTYGGAATQAVFTVDSYGRLTSASNVTTEIALGTNTTGAYVANLIAGTGITLSGLGNEGTTPTITNAGVTSLSSGGYGISVSGATGAVSVTNTGVTRAIAGTGISLDANNGNVTITNNGVTQLTGTANEVTVSGSTGSITIGLPDDVTITRDLTVAGNLYVTGNVVALPVENIVVEDSLIQLANNNISADLIDIGFYGSYNVGGGEHEHTGLFRDASDGRYKLFQGLQGNDNLTSTINISGTGYSVATLVADLIASNANVSTALNFGNEKNQIVPLSSSILEVRGGLGDAAGALSLAAGNYPTSYSKIYLESGKKITLQADEAYVTLFNDGSTKLITMNTTHTSATSTTTGALRVSGGVGITGNIFADYFNGKIDGGTY